LEAVVRKFLTAASFYFLGGVMKSTGVVCAIVLALRIQAAGADSAGWSNAMAKGAEAQHLGNLQAASEAYRRAVTIAEQPGAPERMLPASLNELAAVFTELAQFRDAETQYRRALALLEKMDGKESASYNILLSNLATLYLVRGEPRRAEPMLRAALEKEARVLPPDDPHLACTRSALAELLLEHGKATEARRLLELAVDGYERHPGKHRVEMAIMLNNLGNALRLEKRESDALPTLERSVAIMEEEVGPDHPLMVRGRCNLAMGYVAVGRIEDADLAFRRALEIARMRLSAEHPAHTAVMLRYAEFLRKTGHKKEAKATEAEAKELLRAGGRRTGVGMTVDISAFRQ
jgi:tetratricopeptide (TPR) repeat protein